MSILFKKLNILCFLVQNIRSYPNIEEIKNTLRHLDNMTFSFVKK